MTRLMTLFTKLYDNVELLGFPLLYLMFLIVSVLNITIPVSICRGLAFAIACAASALAVYLGTCFYLRSITEQGSILPMMFLKRSLRIPYLFVVVVGAFLFLLIVCKK